MEEVASLLADEGVEPPAVGTDDARTTERWTRAWRSDRYNSAHAQ